MVNAGTDYIGVGVAAIVFNDKNEIALLLRIQEAGKGLWGLPGGRLRIGETLEAGILREVSEELGVHGVIEKQLGVFEDIKFEGHWISGIYLVGQIDGIPYNRETEFHTELRWFSLNELPTNITDVTRNAIERLKNAKV